MVLKLNPETAFQLIVTFLFFFSFSDFEIFKFVQNYIATFFLSPAWLWKLLN